jgi:uncharacterized protein (DUF488 family)
VAIGELKLFTIGYQGINLPEFIDTLRNNQISILCDVRKNAFSMKRGFSKKWLSAACVEAGIEYEHYPELGIDSNKRKTLVTAEDYRVLFEEYKDTVIQQTRSSQDILLKKIANTNIALMCFEKDPEQCHRTILADELKKRSDIPTEVVCL